ncbi:hypothetical protein Hanom_Chr08g00717481 [Helianthus anomalus]
MDKNMPFVCFPTVYTTRPNSKDTTETHTKLKNVICLLVHHRQRPPRTHPASFQSDFPPAQTALLDACRSSRSVHHHPPSDPSVPEAVAVVAAEIGVVAAAGLGFSGR